MALNLTPDYFEAERRYRQARSPEDKLAALEAMLRAIPKHKSSEKKQADLKTKISELRHALAAPKQKGASVDPYHIERQGAGQVMLAGLPNSGKSSIVGRLTDAPVRITDFPYGTALPVPGMAFHEDVPIELVDLPPITPGHVPGGLANALRHADAVLAVVDLAAEGLLEDVETLLGVLSAHGIGADPAEDDQEPDADLRHMRIGPALFLLGNKLDLPGAADNLAALRELRPPHPPIRAVSAVTGEGLDALLQELLTALDVIRIYTKEPGKPPDREKPFILPAGSTVEELAGMIHKQLAETLKFARVWGSHGHPGQQVQRHHVLHDGDIIELHGA